MALESRNFFELVESNGLVSASQLMVLREAVKKDSLSESDLDKMVAKKIFSRWQAQRLLSDKPNFKIAGYQLFDFMGKDEYGEVYVVREEESKKVLRIYSKQICADKSKLDSLLKKVEAFRELDHDRIAKIESVSEVNGRTLIVTELLSGQDIATSCAGKPQTEKVTRRLVKKLTATVGELQLAGLEHGSINANSVRLHQSRGRGQKSIVMHLPFEIGFHSTGHRQIRSDVVALAELGGGMLSGDFDKPMLTGSEFAVDCRRIADSTDDPSLSDLQSLVAAESIPPIPTVEPSSEGDSLGGFDLEPIGKAVTAEGLDSLSLSNDVFGDFDKVEVVSKIQSSQVLTASATGASMPVIPVDTQTDSAINKMPGTRGASDTQSQSEDDAVATSGRKWLIASISGVAVILLAVVIGYSLMGGTEDNAKDNKLAKNNDSQPVRKTLGVSGAAQKQAGDAGVESEKKGQEASKKGAKNSLKSSGLFANLGEINRRNNTAVDPNGKSETKRGDRPDEKAGKKEPSGAGLSGIGGLTKPGDQPKSTGKSAKVAPSPAKGPKGKTPAQNKNTPSDPAKSDPAKSDPAKSDPAKSDPAKSDDEKADEPEMEDDEPLLVIGSSKKGKGKSSGAKKSSFKNPFLKLPRFVVLKTPKKGESLPPMQLFPIEVPSGLRLIVSLHGGDHASKSKVEFFLKSSRSQDATWNVSAGLSEANAKPVGKFQYSDGSLDFQWDAAAGSVSNAASLVNCGVRIKAADFAHDVALRAPVISTPILFEKSFTTSSESKLENPPNPDNIKIVLVGVPKEFPVFTYIKNQDFLTGRPGAIQLFFKKDSIDVVNVTLSSKIRGSKLQVDWQSNFVTADKQLVKLPGYKTFAKQIEQTIGEIEVLEQRLQQYDAAYNKLQSPQEKSAFTRNFNKKKMETQVRAERPIKKHLLNANEFLKKMRTAKIGVRVYYQAGEIEVDLATPDGKPFSKPQAASASVPKQGKG